MGFQPKRKYDRIGNLQDTRIISDIVNAVRPQADDVVIEIGPGLAAITEPLAKKLNR
ncbi:hypothetical protein OIF98_08960, partial [Neisseria meningitidis]|uniref:rRNA adenine N-6-methyltransferase family protein n=1 Tax=Neisseria meningitidis TaxID=487 RepID=UPI00298E88AE